MSEPGHSLLGNSFEKNEPFVEPTSAERVAAVLRSWLPRVLAVAATLALAGYLALTALLYYRSVSQWGPSELKWGDFALAPFRWAEFREKQGRMLNARGLQRLAAQRYPEAFFDLRAGLTRSAREIAPRLAFANLLSTFNVEQAARELEVGLALAPGNTELTEALIVLRRIYGGTGAVLELTDAPAARAAVGRQKAVFLIQRADALLGVGRAREAFDTLTAVPEEFRATPQFLDPRIRAATAAEEFDEARRLLDASEAALPAAHRARLDCELAVARRDEAALASALRRLPASAATLHDPGLSALVAWHRLGRATLRDREYSNFLEIYASDLEAMKQLGAVLLGLRESALLLGAISFMEERRVEPFVLRVQFSELALREGRFAAAFRMMERWEPFLARLKGAERSEPEFIRRLTRAANDDSTAQATLLGSYFSGLPSALAYPRYLLALDVLPRAGMVETAATIAQQARRRFPMSDALTAKAAELEQQLAARRASLSTPRTAADAEALLRLADARAVLTSIDDQLRERDYAAARASLREIRDAKPAWLDEQSRALALREMQVAVLADEPLTARGSVRRELGRARDERLALDLLQWAQEIRATRAEGAALVRQEIIAAGINSPTIGAVLAASAVQDDLWLRLRERDSALAAMDEALGRRDPDLALRLIALARRAPPAWLGEDPTAVALREMHARLLLRERPAAGLVLRDLVRRGAPGRAAVRALIRELAASGSHEDALHVATRFLELAPDDREGADLLAKLELRLPLERR